MTLDEIKAYVGASDDGGLQYRRSIVDAPYTIFAWTGPVSGVSGWWWALTTASGDHWVVVALGWAAGWETEDRDEDIRRSLRALAGMELDGAPEIVL